MKHPTMKRYLSACLKIGERRHPAGWVRHLAGHASVWPGLATMWLMLLALGQAAQPATPASQVLWYDSPAGNWDSEALPIGNDRLGDRPARWGVAEPLRSGSGREKRETISHMQHSN